MSADALDWRPILAVMAKPETRRVVGLLIVGEDPVPFLDAQSPSRRRHIVESLMRSGVVVESDGALTLVEDAFKKALATAGSRRATGAERFLRDGRIVQYPASPAERERLLHWVAMRMLKPGEVVDEREIGERLRAFSDDAAVLRRYLVDFGIVERRSDGSQYALAQE